MKIQREKMEAQFETNWTISDGSLHTSITFESSDSPLVDSQTLNPTPKRPLILKPLDSGPCEIKISFTQKHEIRQVYVRSTARVYEIYYAPTVKSSNEYLCTVRCGIASREEELPHTTDNEGTICDPLKGSDGEVPGDKFTSESNIGNNEDDWVEVKIPHSSLLANGNNSYPKKTCASRRIIEVGDNTSSINVEQMPKGDAFSSLPKYSYASSVDFEISILDVKFSSWGNSSANSPLETLLGDEAGIEDDEALCVLQDNGGVVIGELPNKLSSMENGEAVPVTSLTDNQLLMDLESDDVGKEGQGMNDKVTGLTQEIFASLI